MEDAEERYAVPRTRVQRVATRRDLAPTLASVTTFQATTTSTRRPDAMAGPTVDPYLVERKAMSIIAPDSPCRYTSKGEYKKPAFVKFDPEDDGANLDEIFWEGENLIHLCSKHHALHLSFRSTYLHTAAVQERIR